MESVQTIAQHLRDLGVRENGVLLVHSSLRSLGKFDGGAKAVITAFLEVLGDGGTLLMPALSYASVGRHQPNFDVRSTPSCIGALPEYFRQRSGTLRSLHPTHSVSGIGKHAGAILKNHQQDTTPCGKNSPFHLLPHYDGQLLFLGCGMRPNTSMHAIEELSEPPYLYSERSTYHMTDEHGNHFHMTIRNHDFAEYEQRYERLAQLLDSSALKTGNVLAADCHLIETAVMWDVAHAKYQAEPLYFVEHVVNNEI